MGVCRVNDVSVPDFCMPGEQRLYYTLAPLEQTGVIFVPADANAFLRPVLTKDEACRLIDSIPSMRAEACRGGAPQELAQHYSEALSSHDCGDLIELIMSIYARKKHREQEKRKFGAVDKAYMKRAEDLLYGELSVALDIPKDSVQGYIAARVRTLEKASAGRA